MDAPTAFSAPTESNLSQRSDSLSSSVRAECHSASGDTVADNVAYSVVDGGDVDGGDVGDAADLEQVRSKVPAAIAEEQEKISGAIKEAIQGGAATVQEAERAVAGLARQTNEAAAQIVSEAQMAVDAVNRTVNQVVKLTQEDGAVAQMIADLRKAGGAVYSIVGGPVHELAPLQRRRAQNWGLTAIAAVAVAVAAVAGSMARSR